MSSSAELTAFAAGLEFTLDDFQRTACEALARGGGVLVCAPTGAGKTVVGEFAVHLALRSDTGKCFYTTPIKALSNQKYHDLVQRYGAARVGLLTGDNAINSEAPVVVMTTEVLRNMLYADSRTLDGLAYVVMDEVHFLADRFRGAVWEEVIIHLPQRVSLVALSATVSNAEEFADWLITVRGETAVVVSEHRPVPLWQHMLVGRRLFDLLREPANGTGQHPADPEAATGYEVNPALLRHARELTRRATTPDGRHRGWRALVPYRSEVVELLDREGLLPAIVFIFSRAGCDQAVQQCLYAGLRLTTPDERDRIRATARERVSGLATEDLAAVGYDQWLVGLERGIAAHHAGALPVFKEVIEDLFVQGLIKVVFATETLSLGINMPARSVVLERLVKFNGEEHLDLTPGEYTQLTGRAGRRGIDVEGHAVVVWSPEIDPRHVAGLASTRTYPLRSSFRPSYNMAVNLVGTLGMAAAREVLGSSFAQFQADRAVVGIARQVRRNQEAIAAHTAELDCDRGDFGEYFRLRQELTERERAQARHRAETRRAVARASLDRLRVGDVVWIPGGRRAGLAVILDPDTGGRSGEPRPLVLTEQRWAGRVPATDFTGPVDPLSRVKVPKHFNHRSPAARRDLAARLRSAMSGADRPPGSRRGRQAADESGSGPEAAEIAELRAALRRHPCHGCPRREEHARAAERRARLERDTEALRARATNRSGSLVRTFDRVCALLTARGYLSRGDDPVTAAGRTLARIWTEADLLVAECLRRGVWDALEPAALAAAVSVVVYESRRDGEEPAQVPRGPIADAVTATEKLAAELAADEADRALGLTRQPDAGFVWPIYRWARGEPLAWVLSSAAGLDRELPAGDFVRWARQVVDLLGQLAEAPGAARALRDHARRAIPLVQRGVVTHVV